MNSIFGRKDREHDEKIQGKFVKKSAAVLAAVAIAGGSTVVGMPEASAAEVRPGYIYWEVTDRYGKPFEGWAVDFNADDETYGWIRARRQVSRYGNVVPSKFGVIDNVVVDPNDRENFEKVKDNYTRRYLLSDLDPRPGHFLVADPLDDLAWMYEPAEGVPVPEIEKPVHRKYDIEADEAADVEGYDLCDNLDEHARFTLKPDEYPYDRGFIPAYDRVEHRLKLDAFTEIDHAGKDHAWLEVKDENFRPGAAVIGDRPFGYRGIANPRNISVDEVLYSAMGRLPENVISDEEQIDFVNMFEDIVPGGEKSSAFAPIHSVGRIAVCAKDREERPLPTITEVVTETPSPVSTTVTIPAVTSTIPGSTITQPPTTVTEPGATVTQSGTTTTLPPVVSTVPGETITQPGTTVTEPAKTIVTTVPGTTVREPGQTVRKPGETVREPGERVVTTVREPGATVTASPVTVEQEKPVEVEGSKTVTSTPEDVAVKVEDQKAVTTTLEDVTVVESTPQSSDSDTPRILASTGANIIGLVGIAGLLLGVAVFITRRKK